MITLHDEFKMSWHNCQGEFPTHKAKASHLPLYSEGRGHSHLSESYASKIYKSIDKEATYYKPGLGVYNQISHYELLLLDNTYLISASAWIEVYIVQSKWFKTEWALNRKHGNKIVPPSHKPTQLTYLWHFIAETITSHLLSELSLSTCTNGRPSP